MRLLRCIVVCLCCVCALLLWSPVAMAGKPVKHKFEGCVVDGLLISKEGKHIKPKKKLPLKKWEGKQVKLKGLLYPGDYFRLKGKAKVVGQCKASITSSKAFLKGWSWALRERSNASLKAKKSKDALTAINKAIKLNGSMYAFYLTRARVYIEQGNIDKAYSDAQKGHELASDKTEKTWAKDVLDVVAELKKSK